MAMGMAHLRRHEWSFAGANGDGTSILIAVCRACGVIRTEVALPKREAHLDLSGACSDVSGQPSERLGQFG